MRIAITKILFDLAWRSSQQTDERGLQEHDENARKDLRPEV